MAEKRHWHEKWRAIDLYLNDINGVVTRVGDKTAGEIFPARETWFRSTADDANRSAFHDCRLTLQRPEDG
jgi:hypothetical protein